MPLPVSVFFFRLSYFVAIATLSGHLAAAAGVSEKIRFNQQIRPILSEACFACHGPDDKKREAHLRLDTKEGASKDLGGYAAIVPGRPDQSELLDRVVSHDPDDVMPPPKSKKPRLSEGEVAILKRWIAQGAEYESHWAFLPLASDPPPPVKNGAWVKNPIDRFILGRLEAEGIAPSPEADRETLIRRATLDLIGLLPTPDEVRAFLQDSGPGAYERVVDRLLASPHYGERWGRHWLDQARYADSNGFTIDGERAMWPYRDWVIKALNDDMPFDRFTIEQLAGDRLPNPTKSQLVATGFHRNTLINEEGGVNAEQFRNEAVIDRVNTTGSVWLGLTVGCAQCHNHKYDPIAQREYYQMFAFFNQGEDVNSRGATIDVAKGEVFGQTASAETQKKQADVRGAEEQAGWEKRELAKRGGVAPAVAKWVPAKYLEYDTATNAGFQLLPDNSLLSDGRGAFNDTYRVVATTSLPRVAAIRLRVLTHDSLPKGGPGLAGNGNFVLTHFDAAYAGAPRRLTNAFADHEQPKFPALAAIDEDPKSGWAINVGKGSAGKMNADHEIVFILDQPVEAQPDQSWEFHLHHDLNQNYLIGRFALDLSETAPSPSTGTDALAEDLAVAPAERSAAQRQRITEAFRRDNPQFAAPKTQSLTEASSSLARLMIMKDLEQPRQTFILQRGDFLRPDQAAGPLQPGIISAVQESFHHPVTSFRDRLDLARWLVNPENPLTPRVTMNRVWMHYFGRGLVETEDDFGTQGSRPTHPELLDWLAREFIARGWSMKAMHRLIATSAVYRQSSHARSELADRDPRNLLLARQERLRVEGEIARDAALTASGLLNPAIGGPSVRPPQPPGVYSFTQNARKWTAETGPERFRRALYTVFYRSAPYPLFTTFDSPDFQNVCTRRARSDTPLQSLTLANDAAFFEIARGLALRVLSETSGAGDEQVARRIRRAWELCLCREPSPKEQSILSQYYDRQLRGFRDDPDSAQKVSNDEFSRVGAPPDEAAALISVARTIFNSDAFITRE